VILARCCESERIDGSADFKMAVCVGFQFFIHRFYPPTEIFGRYLSASEIMGFSQFT